ncbi:MAG: ribosome maturation factor RimM [Actinomycetota bacterium]
MNSVIVGYVRRGHGLNGAVIVRPLTDDATQRWRKGARLSSDGEPPVAYIVAQVGPHKDGLLVQFEGVNDRNAADGLRGTSFTIPSDERRALEGGEYWPDDLTGCAVVDEHDQPLGAVVGVEFGAAQDRLVVQTDEGTVEVPFVDALVPTVDLENRRVVVIALPGLFSSD